MNMKIKKKELPQTKPYTRIKLRNQHQTPSTKTDKQSSNEDK